MRYKYIALAIITGVAGGMLITACLIVLLFKVDLTQTYKQAGTFLSNARHDAPKPYVVQSGSMEPAIKTGSVIFVVPKDNYIPSDIITFKQTNKDNLVTHRIELKNYPNGFNSAPTYTTAGDANEDFDTGEVKQEDVVGKVYFSVPYVGYGVSFAKSPKGYILLIIIPATIIVYEEIKSVFGEIKKLFKKFKSKTKKETHSKKFLKGAVIIPVVGAFLITAGIVGSYFFDYEKAIGNVFSAASEYPTPEPTSPPPSPSASPSPSPLKNPETTTPP
jgi:signal peptidase